MTFDQLSEFHSLLQRFTLTDIEDNDQDVTILHYLALHALDAAEQLATNPSVDDPIVILMREIPGGLQLRIVSNTSASPHRVNLSFVGFISKKQPSITLDIQNRVNAADSGMLLELAKQPALLSYTSLQLADENWYNLVLFSHEGAKHDILTTSLHHYAAYELAPHYYEWIRLHHGIIEQQNTSLKLMLHTTKYYTFPTPAAAPAISVQAHQPVHAIASVTAM